MPASLEDSIAASSSEPLQQLRPKFRVEMFGSAPPPYGGVTIHCVRLLQHLHDLGYEVRLWDVGGHEGEEGRLVPYDPRVASRALTASDNTVIHWHKIPDRRAMAQVLIDPMTRRRKRGLRQALVFSFHNSRLQSQFEAAPVWKRVAIRRFIAQCDAITFDAEMARDDGIAIGCPPDRCHVVSAFLPPPTDSLRPGSLPASVRSFLADHAPVLSATGWTIDFFNGVDIYGMDILVEVMGRLIRRHPKIGLIFRLANIEHSDYFDALRAKAVELGIDRNILWVTAPLESAAAIWKAADVFVRPSCTDGDSLAIREALECGTPVVASDAVARPAACHMFRNRDSESLHRAIEQTLAQDGSEQPLTPPCEGHPADGILRVYTTAFERTR